MFSSIFIAVVDGDFSWKVFNEIFDVINYENQNMMTQAFSNALIPR